MNKPRRVVTNCYSNATIEAILQGQSSLNMFTGTRIKRPDKKCLHSAIIPAHVGIGGNEAADALAKEARKLESNNSNLFIIDVANVLVRYRIGKKSVKIKHQIREINTNIEIIKKVTRLRTHCCGDIKIKKRWYQNI